MRIERESVPGMWRNEHRSLFCTPDDVQGEPQPLNEDSIGRRERACTSDVVSKFLRRDKRIHGSDPLEEISSIREETLIVVRVEKLFLSVVSLRCESVERERE